MNLSAVFIISAVIGTFAGPAVFANRSKHIQENKLAGVRPRKDRIEQVYQRFGKDRMNRSLSSANSYVWIDNCNHGQLTVHVGSDHAVDEITVQPAQWVINADCELKAYTRNRASFGAGHGLVFNDNCDRVGQLYGTPESTHDTEENHQALRVMRYSGFGRGHSWLTFDVGCSIASGRVQRMTLTASRASAAE